MVSPLKGDRGTCTILSHFLLTAIMQASVYEMKELELMKIRANEN